MMARSDIQRSKQWIQFGMIKLALDTIDLVILRWQVDDAMSNKPVDR